MLKFGSVCSGIGGNSIALHPLQWLFERIDAIHEVILDIG
jgi:site-specific DNA-cytosine methylase